MLCHHLHDCQEYSQEDGATLSSKVHSNRITGTGDEQKHRKFYLKMGKNLFTLRVTEQWYRMSREAVESPLEIFKTQLDVILCNLL